MNGYLCAHIWKYVYFCGNSQIRAYKKNVEATQSYLSFAIVSSCVIHFGVAVLCYHSLWTILSSGGVYANQTMLC